MLHLVAELPPQPQNLTPLAWYALVVTFIVLVTAVYRLVAYAAPRFVREAAPRQSDPGGATKQQFEAIQQRLDKMELSLDKMERAQEAADRVLAVHVRREDTDRAELMRVVGKIDTTVDALVVDVAVVKNDLSHLKTLPPKAA